jgi:hypothetical protein
VTALHQVRTTKTDRLFSPRRVAPPQSRRKHGTLGTSTPKETLQASLERFKKRIQAKQSEIKNLEADARQVEDALKALK